MPVSTTPSKPIRPDEMEPIFVLGRQHSGNTMLTTVLGKLPGMIGVRSEGDLIEQRRVLDRFAPEERAEKTARRIRDDGVRKLFREEGIAMRPFWDEATVDMAEAARHGADAPALYAMGMQRVLDHFGAARWVQKGTSYIFVAEEIFQIFPRAKQIFIARNPLDLAASTKKRNETGRHTLRVGLGWRRGVQRALAMEKAHPDRFRIVRYEDLVREPGRVVQELCDFADLAYDPSCLEIPHVNKADAPYRTKGEVKGLTASRIFYYDAVLSGGEQAALRAVVGRPLMRRLYPELDADGSGAGLAAQAAVLVGGALSIVGGEVQRLVHAPRQAWTRVRNRV